jgi:hypothetical protein
MKLLKRKGECRVAIMPPGVSILFSYSTAVGAHIGTTVYRSKTYHSRTTLVHINRWVRDMRTHFPEDIRRVRRVTQDELKKLVSSYIEKGEISGLNT